MIQQNILDLRLIFYFLFLLLALGSLVLLIAALVSFLNTENMGDDRVVWVIIIVLTGPIGSILWFYIGRPKFRKLSQSP